MSALEPPIERVNYFNGERLEARDFRAEQDYQVRVRRILNRSLYSSGIVRGLEVTKHPTDKHKVLVGTGLAFDAAGREIIVIDPQAVQVMGAPSTTAGLVLGNFLVISYLETRGQPATSACQSVPDACSCAPAAAGPTRIRTDVQFEVVDAWPSEASGRVVLAQLELKQGCEIAKIHPGVRKYAIASKPPKVRLVSIEGEKDINKENPKTLYFHVEGGYPDNVTLHLKASLLSTLFYTEMGTHTHVLDLTLAEAPAIPPHEHTLGDLLTDEFPAHSHKVTANVSDSGDGIELGGMDSGGSLTDQVSLVVSPEGKHTHKVGAGQKTDKIGGTAAHNHPFTKKDAQPFGATTKPALSGPQLTYVNDLRVWFDGTQITTEVLQQLAGRDPTNWLGETLGDGTSTHVLVTQGTKAINLLQIVEDIAPGEHKLEFKVVSGGGQIHYNLYVE